MMSWADEIEEELNQCSLVEPLPKIEESFHEQSKAKDDGWTQVNEMKEQKKKSTKPIYFGKGITSFRTFEMSYPALMKIDGKHYSSCMHYVESKKCEMFGSETELEKVMKARWPKEINQITMNLKNYDKVEWQRIQEGIINDSLHYKFNQVTYNQDQSKMILDSNHQKVEKFRQELLATQSKKLYLIGVRYWGVESIDNLIGENVLGQLLENLREEKLQ